MALNIIIINKVSVAASFAAGATVATAVASGGTAPYVYSLATGGDKFAINSSTGVVTTIAAMDINNIASFSVTATDSTTGTALTGTSSVTYPPIQSAIQNRFNKPNTIYKVTKDITLSGGTLTIPEGCTLDFQGGSFTNGVIIFNKTYITGSTPKIYATKLQGTLSNKEINVKWFGNKIGVYGQDCTAQLKVVLDFVRTPYTSFTTDSNYRMFTLFFPAGEYNISDTLFISTNISIKGVRNNFTRYNSSGQTIIKATITDPTKPAICISEYLDSDENFNTSVDYTRRNTNVVYYNKQNILRDFIVLNAGNSNIGIQSMETINFLYERISINGFKIGLYIQDGWQGLFQDSIINASQVGVVVRGDNAGLVLRHLLLWNSRSRSTITSDIVTLIPELGYGNFHTYNVGLLLCSTHSVTIDTVLVERAGVGFKLYNSNTINITSTEQEVIYECVIEALASRCSVKGLYTWTGSDGDVSGTYLFSYENSSYIEASLIGRFRAADLLYYNDDSVNVGHITLDYAPSSYIKSSSGIIVTAPENRIGYINRTPIIKNITKNTNLSGVSGSLNYSNWGNVVAISGLIIFPDDTGSIDDSDILAVSSTWVKTGYLTCTFLGSKDPTNYPNGISGYVYFNNDTVGTISSPFGNQFSFYKNYKRIVITGSLVRIDK